MNSLTSSQEGVMASLERPNPPTRKPSLLPAFEPLSSSPGGLPRQSVKRKFDEHQAEDRKYYPTPVPTSSTGILPSSPVATSRPGSTHPALQRTVSTLSNRAPLGSVPTIDLPADGEPVLMGRSSNSSDHQLSANRLISRVHVRAAYHAPSESRLQGEVLVECLGWNGAKVHYQGSVVELAKGESFVSQKPGSQIIVDVVDKRVMLAWPGMEAEEEDRSAWDEDTPTRGGAIGVADRIASSPPAMSPGLQSPISPSPAQAQLAVDATFASTFLAEDHLTTDDTVQVYEDDESADELPGSRTPVPVSRNSPEASKQSTPSKQPRALTTSKSSEPEELSEHDEENDPIVHSFGPFGENLLSRFESFQSSSPDQRRKMPLKASTSSPNPKASQSPVARRQINVDVSPVKNHVINQLAFSRVHSIPLSTIYNNLPITMRADKSSAQFLTSEDLKEVMDKIPCVGEIKREGRDAAGKPLEDEFYYVSEMDSDEHRKAAVSIAKPPLRSTRKQHKQYYWKKPRI